MAAILRSVAKTDTFEQQRLKINQIATDLYAVQTSVGEGAFSMSDGSVQSPALFFTNANDVGIFKGPGKSLYVAADGNSVASFNKTEFVALQNFKTLISSVPIGAGGITISNPGSQYSAGTFSAVPLSGGSGTGLLATLVVRPITGTITNGGNGYVGGSYVSVPLTGGTGTGATADITVSPFSGSIQNGGSGGSVGGVGSSATFTNVSLTGGSGSNMRADIVVTNTGAATAVTSVNIVNQGSGYQTGNVLSATSSAIGGVTGFQYVINGVGNVSQVQILLADSGYQVGNVLSASNTNLGGSGSGFQFTVTGVGTVVDASVTNGGDGYLVGDQLSVNAVELAPVETWYVRMWMTQLFVFSGTLPTTGFNVGNTLTYSGESRTIVKRFLNAQNRVEAVAVRAGAEDGNTIQFSNGLSASDGNGNTALVASSTSALNYYFSLNANGPFENIKDFTFQKNKRYVFNQANSSNNTHPIRFSTSPDGIHTLLSGQGAQADYGDPYTGSEVNYQYTSVDIAITPNDNTPTTLYYYCSNGFGDPLNQHINEGGFDGREGKITISGTATISGSGLQITVGTVNNSSNIILNKDGTATLGATSASSLSLTNNLSVGGTSSLGGDLTVGTNKFTVAGSSGNTVIAGTLTVNDDLSFLSDAAFGSTLYVDSVNKKVSVNIDPAITPLTYAFEVSGDLKNNGDAYLSSASGKYVRIGNTANLSGTSKLQVDGSISSTTGYRSSPSTDIKSPSYTFANNTRYGIAFVAANSALSTTVGSGESLRFTNLTTTSYRNFDFDYKVVSGTTITGGTGYTNGTYNGIQPSGGSGTGFTINATVSGTSLTGIVVTDSGVGYEVGDVLTVNLPGIPGAAGATVTITNTTTTNTASVNVSTGTITANALNTIGSGILVDNKLSIDGTAIASTQNEDITITPGASSRILSVSGTGGVKLPVGNSTNRPSATTAGIIRYNTQTSQYEGSNGVNFISLGGVRDVDGNTYIIAEETVGANDNVLYFYNDGYNSARLKRTELELTTATKISARDTDGKLLWKPSTTYALNSYVYFGDNIYQVTTAGTTGTVAPSHITGAVANGTATLTWYSDSYTNLEIRGDEIKLGTRLNIDDKLSVYAYSTTNLILENGLNTTKFAFGNILGVPDTLLTLNGTTGSLVINRNYDASSTEDNISILDKTLKFFEITDVRNETASATLVKGTSNVTSTSVYTTATHASAKILVSADNTTTGDKQIVEYNVIHKGTDIFAVQYGNINTANSDLFDATFDFDGSGNVRFTATLASAVANGNSIKIVVSKTQIKK